MTELFDSTNARPPRHQQDALMKKVFWRLLPFLFTCYLLSYIQRINIGYAQLQMRDSVGIGDAAYGLGAGIFFVGYVLFEIPSNLLLHRIGARRTISRIMVLWGIVSTLTLFIRTPSQFIIARALLGASEAGLFPGVVLYLTYWFPTSGMAKVTSSLFIAGAMSGLIAGPMSAAIMTHMNAMLGMEGWQWMLLIEGLPASMFGIAAYFYLPDRPENAKWLSKKEKYVLLEILKDQDFMSNSRFHSNGIRDTLKTPVVYALTFVLFTIICGNYGVVFWMPIILGSHSGTSTSQVGLYSVIPYATTMMVSLVLSRHSDTTGERRWHIVTVMAIAAVGLLMLTIKDASFSFQLAGVTLIELGTASAFPIFWTLPSRYLSGAATAVGLALINSFGALGGLLCPWAMGVFKRYTGSLDIAFYCLISLLVVGAFVLMTCISSDEK